MRLVNGIMQKKAVVSLYVCACILLVNFELDKQHSVFVTMVTGSHRLGIDQCTPSLRYDKTDTAPH